MRNIAVFLAVADVLNAAVYILLRLLILADLLQLAHLLLIFITIIPSMISSINRKEEIEAVSKRVGRNVNKKLVIVIVAFALQIWWIWTLLLRPPNSHTLPASLIFLVERIKEWLEERQKKSLRIEIKVGDLDQILEEFSERMRRNTEEQIKEMERIIYKYLIPQK